MIPKAVGPYSLYRKVGDFIYFSGQLGLDPKTNKLQDGIENQTKQALENIKNILKEEGYEMSSIIKTLVLLKDISDYAVVNEIYKEYFSSPYPARSAFSVKDLPLNALVEIEVISYV